MEGVFTAPQSGVYKVSGTVSVRTQKIGTQFVKNPNRRWYQFWKPRKVEIEVYQYEDIPMEGRDIRLNKDEQIHLKLNKMSDGIRKVGV